MYCFQGQNSSMHSKRRQNRSITWRSVNQPPAATVAISQVMKFTPPVPKCPRHMFSVLAVCSCTKVVIDMEHNRPANPCDIFGHMIIAWCWLNRFHLITGTISNHRSHWHSRWVGHRMWRIPCSSSNPKAESSPIFDMVILWQAWKQIYSWRLFMTHQWLRKPLGRKQQRTSNEKKKDTEQDKPLRPTQETKSATGNTTENTASSNIQVILEPQRTQAYSTSSQPVNDETFTFLVLLLVHDLNRRSLEPEALANFLLRNRHLDQRGNFVRSSYGGDSEICFSL